jgi:hypothetical protein
VAFRRVNEVDFYSLGLRDLAHKLGTHTNRLLWLIQKEGVQKDPEFLKAIKIGKTVHKRYSAKCYEAFRAQLAEVDLDALWKGRKAAKAIAKRPRTRLAGWHDRHGTIRTTTSSTALRRAG